MKYILCATLSLMSLTHLFAQSTINLPVYTQGKYELDTIYSHYGPLYFTGKGSITISGTLLSNFVSGVKFKMVVDSINQGASPTHAAFWDVSGTWVNMYKGDTVDIPSAFILMAGAIGFHIIIEGIPLIAGQSYLCNLGFVFITGNDWGMIISEISQSICIVDQAQGVHDNKEVEKFTIYPNPAGDIITIKSNTSLFGSMYTISDQLGRKVSTDKLINETTTVNINQLSGGVYLFRIEGLDQQKFKVIKK